ncbi:MAG: hypothetical protein H7839_12835 [Magnetococcus sp. YQC-5]
MNVSNSLMSDVSSMNSSRASHATRQIIEKTQNESNATLQAIAKQNSLTNYMTTKAFSVNISPAGMQKSALSS